MDDPEAKTNTSQGGSQCLPSVGMRCPGHRVSGNCNFPFLPNSKWLGSLANKWLHVSGFCFPSIRQTWDKSDCLMLALQEERWGGTQAIRVEEEG